MAARTEQELLEQEFRKISRKWYLSNIITDIFMHAGALYAVYLMVVGGFHIPKTFDPFTYWIFFAASMATAFLGLAILGVIFPRHYIKQKRLRYRWVFAGLILFFTGLTSSFVTITAAVPAFTIWMWVAMYVLFWMNMLGITIGYHRLSTHRSFECGKLFTRFLYGQGAIARQNEIDWWGPKHLIHHDRTEIEAQDPHTPRESFLHAHIGWVWRRDVYPESIIQLKRYTRRIKDDPLVQEQKKYYNPVMVLGFTAPSLIFCFISFFQDISIPRVLWEGWKAFLLAGLVRFVISYHITMSVNSWSHTWGPQPYRNKKTGDSRDVWYLSLFSAGENLQNIHHLFDSIACYWIRFYYFDISGAIIVASERLGRFRYLQWLGLPYNLKVIKEQHLRYMAECRTFKIEF